MEKIRPRVYLAGGMRSGWREVLKEWYQDVDFLDPTTTGYTHELDYTNWYLWAVSACDILFGYLEMDNPSGFGLMVEIGAASALGKPVIFVDERPDLQKYTGMARSIARESGVYTDSLSAGCRALTAMVETWPWK
jgi:hypothetical protein